MQIIFMFRSERRLDISLLLSGGWTLIYLHYTVEKGFTEHLDVFDCIFWESVCIINRCYAPEPHDLG